MTTITFFPCFDASLMDFLPGLVISQLHPLRIHPTPGGGAPARLDRPGEVVYTSTMFRRSAATTAFYLAAAGGLAVFLAVLRQSESYTVLNHGLRVYGRHVLPLLGLWAAAFGALLLVSASSARREAEVTGL